MNWPGGHQTRSRAGCRLRPAWPAQSSPEKDDPLSDCSCAALQRRRSARQPRWGQRPRLASFGAHRHRHNVTAAGLPGGGGEEEKPARLLRCDAWKGGPGRATWRPRLGYGVQAEHSDQIAVTPGKKRITSCLISRSQRELVPLLSLQSIAITHSRVMAKDDPRLPLLEKQQEDLLPRGGPAVGAGLEGYCWQGHKPAEGGQERLLVEFSAVVADIGRIDPDPLTLDERRAQASVIATMLRFRKSAMPPRSVRDGN